MAIGPGISNAKQCSHKVELHCLVIAISEDPVAFVNWILQSLGKGTSCQIPTIKVSGEAAKKMQVTGLQADKWLLLGEGESEGVSGGVEDDLEGCMRGTAWHGRGEQGYERCCVDWRRYIRVGGINKRSHMGWGGGLWAHQRLAWCKRRGTGGWCAGREAYSSNLQSFLPASPLTSWGNWYGR